MRFEGTRISPPVREPLALWSIIWRSCTKSLLFSVIWLSDVGYIFFHVTLVNFVTCFCQSGLFVVFQTAVRAGIFLFSELIDYRCYYRLQSVSALSKADTDKLPDNFNRASFTYWIMDMHKWEEKCLGCCKIGILSAHAGKKIDYWKCV